MQHGSSAGISGLIQFTGSPKFWLKILQWEETLTNQRRPRDGRGTGRWQQSRPMRPGGTLALSGKIRLDGWPFPADWRGQEGMITAQLHKDVESGLDVKQVIGIRVLTAKLEFDEKTKDGWDISLTAEITSMPTLTGFGTSANSNTAQPAADVPVGGQQEVYDELGKAIDPTDINTTGTKSIDIWVIGDTDAAEMQVIADVIAASVVPIPNTKLRNATFKRTDAEGGYIVLSYGKTTVAEDLINQSTETRIDVSGLTSTATSAGINTPGAAPIGDAFVKVSTATKEINDQNVLVIDDYALRTPQQAHEEDNSNKEVDPQSLNDEGALAYVTTSAIAPAVPTSPTTGKIRKTITKQLNPTHWLHIFMFGRRDSMDDLLMEATVAIFDPNGLASQYVVALFSATSTAPTTPAAPADDVKFIDRQKKQIHDTAFLWLYKFGPRDSADEIVLPHNVAIGTVDGAVQWTFGTIVNGSSAFLQAATEWAARKGDVAFERVDVRTLKDGKLLQTVVQTDAYQIVSFSADTGGIKQWKGARINSGTVQVFLADKIQLPGSRWLYRLGIQAIQVTQMRFRLSRKVSGGTLPVFFNLSGTTNSGDFLGLPANTVAYMNTEGATNINIATPRVTPMSWWFFYDSAGFVDESQLPFGYWVNTADNLTSLTAQSWVNVSSIPSLSAPQQATGDYSQFLA